VSHEVNEVSREVSHEVSHAGYGDKNLCKLKVKVLHGIHKYS